AKLWRGIDMYGHAVLGRLGYLLVGYGVLLASSLTDIQRLWGQFHFIYFASIHPGYFERTLLTGLVMGMPNAVIPSSSDVKVTLDGEGSD
ncbi:hypothetical protein E2562_017541, partial [Oryza meyeriana var. granulata]